jgi:DNA-binding transcriptional MerR regulator
MRIGELAEQAGTTRRALRYYEEEGLLEAARASNGYREYDESALNRVDNIRFLIDAGLTVEDVRLFLPCLDGDMRSSEPCSPSARVVHRRLDALTARIDAMTQTRDRLAGMLRTAGHHLTEVS